jgi:hypothetical protein
VLAFQGSCTLTLFLILPPDPLRNMAQRHGNQAKSVPTGFFALPQEIRDLIYHELWAFTSYVRLTLDTPDSTSFSLLYGAAEADRSCGLPRWLLVNKAIFQEGLCQFFRHARWYLEACTKYKLNSHAQENVLVGLSAATNIALFDHYRKHESRPPMALYSIRIDYTHHPYQSILPLLSSNLRALTLDLPIKAAASRDITMDLTSLSLYGLQLNKLVIYMRLYLWALTA